MAEALLDMIVNGGVGLLFAIFMVVSLWSAWMFVYSEIGSQASQKVIVLWWYGGAVVSMAICLGVGMVLVGLGKFFIT